MSATTDARREGTTGAGTGPGGSAGKGRPTPKRSAAQAANKRPLVPVDRKAAAREARAKQRLQRDLEYRAMQSGDERYMPAKDRGPVRRYVRDFVDARRSLGEIFLPVAFLMLVVQTFTMQRWAAIGFALMVLLYLYILASVVDGFLLWRRLKRRLVEKFGATAGVPRGILLYALTRAFQVRRLRMPKPQAKHGQWPA